MDRLLRRLATLELDHHQAPVAVAGVEVDPSDLGRQLDVEEGQALLDELRVAGQRPLHFGLGAHQHEAADLTQGQRQRQGRLEKHDPHHFGGVEAFAHQHRPAVLEIELHVVAYGLPVDQLDARGALHLKAAVVLDEH